MDFQSRSVDIFQGNFFEDSAFQFDIDYGKTDIQIWIQI